MFFYFISTGLYSQLIDFYWLYFELECAKTIIVWKEKCKEKEAVKTEVVQDLSLFLCLNDHFEDQLNNDNS